MKRHILRRALFVNYPFGGLQTKVGRAAVSDYGTPWTFLLSIFLIEQLVELLNRN